MRYAVKLGPIETGEGACHAYLAFSDEELGPPVLATSDEEGLAGLLAALDDGEELRCEPQLGPAGRALGVRACEPPAWVLEPRGTFAVATALGDLIPPDLLGPLPILCGAAARFLAAAPWERLTDTDELVVSVAGPRTARYEGAIMGSAGIEIGLALYEKVGAVARLARAPSDGPALEEDSIAVTFDEPSPLARRALEAAFDLGRLPVPLRLAGGKVGPCSSLDVAVLATSLLCAAKLKDRDRAAGSLATPLGEIVVDVTVGPSAPPPRRRPPRPTRPRRGRGKAS